MSGGEGRGLEDCNHIAKVLRLFSKSVNEEEIKGTGIEAYLTNLLFYKSFPDKV